MVEEIDPLTERTRYYFSISLRMRHPTADPQNITETLGIQPTHWGKAGERRRTPKGRILDGVYDNSFWIAKVSTGKWPTTIGNAIHDVLKRLAPHRSNFHTLRAEGGKIELFIGWFFENQSGDVLSHHCLALAGDLQIDLSLDVYPPDQPQNEQDKPAAGE